MKPAVEATVISMSALQNGLYSAIPFVMFWACINAAGASADALLTRGWKTANVRKIAQSLGNILHIDFAITN